jgi:hypothetical protein
MDAWHPRQLVVPFRRARLREIGGDMYPHAAAIALHKTAALQWSTC